MSILNSKIPRYILTKRGIINENEIVPGDIFYEYGTGNELEVTGVEPQPFETMYLVKYSDSREDIVTNGELIYSGTYLFYPMDIDKVDKGSLIPTVLKYNHQVPMSNTDAYLSGAFLSYGDLSSKYLSIKTSVLNDNLDYMLNLYKAGESGEYTLFKYKKNDEECITWEEYFKDFAVSPNMVYPMKYLYGSLNTRKRFLRGVFDCGYDKELSPDDVSILHDNLNILHQIQRMLWSCGILSYVFTEKTMKGYYRLQLLGASEYSTEFFYNEEYILNMLNSNINTSKLDPTFKWELYDINMMSGVEPSYVPRFYIKDRNHALYLNGDFIPKVSL